MYKKQKTYTLPVEDREVIIPHELVPDYTDVCYVVMGEETKGTPIPGGVLIAYSDNDEESVTIKYDYEEKTDTVTPVVDAIKAIPETVIPEADYSVVTDALKSVEDAVFATESDDLDLSPVVAGLAQVKDAVANKEIPEPESYAQQLQEIADKIQTTDLSEVAALLRALVEKETPVFEIPPNLISDNRLKVEVDRIGTGGGAAAVRTPNDWYHEVAGGKVTGYTKVNKFGRATNCDSGVDTDIHDGANAASYPTAALDDRDIWTAPTQARVHTIQSTSANDTATTGTGARTIQVYGLTDWDSKETSEVIEMNGTTTVNTTNSYVIIHRMKVLTSGGTNINEGTIYATATTDATITAQINPDEGQTQMAVYGVPSAQRVYLESYYASAIKGSLSVSSSISLLLNPEPDNQTTAFQVKHTQGLVTDGSNYVRHEAHPPMTFSGPCIIKMQANTSSNDTDISAGFDLVLEDV